MFEGECEGGELNIKASPDAFISILILWRILR